MNTSTFISIVLLLILFFAIPVSLGFYVYKDASCRGMNAVLWTLLSIVTPGLLGAMLYFIVRTGRGETHYHGRGSLLLLLLTVPLLLCMVLIVLSR